jgi:hypothetical protein
VQKELSNFDKMEPSSVTRRLVVGGSIAPSDGSPTAVEDFATKLDPGIWAAIERENDLLKKVEILLEKRLRKEAGITRFGLTWFAGLFTVQIGLVLIYVFLRGSGYDITESSVIGPEEQVLIFVAIFLGFTFFDVFNMCVCPDRRVADEAKNVANTHVIIAAHRAAQSLDKMLPRVLAVFTPDHVWVADNGYPDEATQQLCRRLGVHYRYNSIGNKANALLQCAMEIKESTVYDVDNGTFGRDKYCHISNKNLSSFILLIWRYSMTIVFFPVVLLDDDTLLSEDFFVRHDLLAKPRVAGYCVGIGVARSPGYFNLWEVAIDYEYRAISHRFGAQAAASSSTFLHGICAVYSLPIMIELFSRNATLPGGLPFGEDAFAGLDARRLGYRLLQDNQNLVLTYCPRAFWPGLCNGSGRTQGYGAATIWKQRANRWFLNWPRRLLAELWLFVTYGPRLNLWGIITYRIYMIWWIALNFVGFLWVPYLVWFLITNTGGWRYILFLKASLFVTSIVGATLRIICMPAKLRNGLHPLAPFCFPVLSLANLAMRAWAFASAMYWFIPFVRSGNIRTVPNYDLGNESVKMLDNSNSSGVRDLSFVKRSIVPSGGASVLPGTGWADEHDRKDMEESSNSSIININPNSRHFYYNSDWEEELDDGFPVYV